MKSKRTFFMILVFAMALLMFSTSCGNRTSPEESKSSDTPLTEVKEPADTTSEPTSEPEMPSTAADKTEPKPSEEAPKPSEADQPEVETVEAKTMDTAAGLGVWISTMKFGKDTQLGNLRYRVTSLSDDQEAIMAAIEAYNEDDDNYRKVDTDFPANFILKLCEYEVVYAKDYPGYGDEGTTIYSPDLYFNIAAEGGGGLDTADGLTYIGLNCIDISKKVQSIETGEVFKGLVVYAIPNNAIEQYYISYGYSDKDADGNAMTVYSYVKPEEIKAD